MKVRIYTLTDPRTNIVMYVGRTILRLCNRLSSHVHCAKHNKTPRDLWFKELLDLGLKPIITCIEEVSHDIWEEKEKYWIAYYKKINPNLCNLAIGGGGPLGCKPQRDVILSMSKIHSKPVYQLTYDYEIVKLHDSCKQASKEVNCADTCISTAARSKGLKSAANSIWIYLSDYNEWIKNNTSKKYEIDYSYLSSKVSQYDKNGNLIKEWSSQTEAAKSLNIRREGITRAKCGDRPSYKGFIWK